MLHKTNTSSDFLHSKCSKPICQSLTVMSGASYGELDGFDTQPCACSHRMEPRGPFSSKLALPRINYASMLPLSSNVKSCILFADRKVMKYITYSVQPQTMCPVYCKLILSSDSTQIAIAILNEKLLLHIIYEVINANLKPVNASS